MEKQKQRIQFVLFSATYPTEVSQQIGNLIGESSQIRLENCKLQLDNIRQFHIRTPHQKKIDFVYELFKHSGKNQTMIFVNTKKFA